MALRQITNAELDAVSAGALVFAAFVNQQNFSKQTSTQTSVNIVPIYSASGNQYSNQQVQQGNNIG